MEVPVDQLVITGRTTVDVGETIQLSARIYPWNADNQAITWSTSNSAIATVSQTGYVEAKSRGTVTITAKTANGKMASVSILVRQLIDITFDANGGTISLGGETMSLVTKIIYIYAGNAIGFLLSPTKDFYLFNGWYSEPDGGVLYGASSVFTANTTLYAHWSPMGYEIRYYVGGVTTSDTGYVDQEIGDLRDGPTKTGYTFDGWYTAPDGGTKVTSAYKQSTTATLTLYPHYKGNPYKLYFNANGGSFDPDEPSVIDVIYGKKVGTLPKVSLTGFDFDGWYTS